ncbi:RNA polymerase sigma-70 factor, sigma-E family [Actinokineospora alba]|uniref:RNA polymerase sigma-70 factor, sigma-E family n=1 Tax=Actinokineospora alba TaxID=504798 RepID=A0A1H0PT04_9PSEU|nr:SigE family RNA polymerase sigma factor [Actinokineospora alba]TDP65919.1 RNA polymerase sigma-70 factor (sigma-E family) [Actinokineospora alba]SDI62206.1 RNA polymerase sigma-70 factor, sigma-E family [Actinokineospora alba]SDP07785.1 RNA polymerase sigma-70 factor, sigma-E family [Actinokineospora alba]
MRDDEDFRVFAHEHARTLRRSAYLFCGDWHTAEDLVQTTLVKIYRSWSKLGKRDTVHNYARTVLLRTWLDEKRKPWRRREPVGSEVPDTADPNIDIAEGVGRSWDRDLVHQALLTLAPRQRAVLVLRYFDELSVAETARVMRCTEGTVKSQAARGLDSLRAAVARLSEGELEHA